MSNTLSPSISTTINTRSPIDGAIFGRDRESASRSDFAAVLGRMGQGAGESDEQLARRSAENFVSMTLIQPLLKQLRSSTNAAPPFAPTDGEKQFQGLMDGELAQRIVRTAQFPLVDRIAHDIMERSRSATGRTGAASATPLTENAEQTEVA